MGDPPDTRDDGSPDDRVGEDPGSSDPHAHGDRDPSVPESDASDIAGTESLDDVRGIELDAAIEEADCERDAVAIHLFAETELSLKELSELTVHDVGLESREVRVGDRPDRVEQMSPELAADVQTWLEDHRPGYAASGNDRYLFPDVTGGRLPAGRIREMLREVGASVAEERMADSETEAKTRAESIASCDRGKDSENPDDQIRSRPVLSRGELERVYDAAQSPQDRLILRLIAETGLLASEIPDLDLDEVDTDENTLHVAGKAGEQTIPISGDLAAEIEERGDR